MISPHLLSAAEFLGGWLTGGAFLWALNSALRRRARPAPDPAAVTAAVAAAMHALTGILAPVREAAQGEKTRLEQAGFPEELAAQMAAQLWALAVRSLPLTMADGIAASAGDWPQEADDGQGGPLPV